MEATESALHRRADSAVGTEARDRVQVQFIRTRTSYNTRHRGGAKQEKSLHVLLSETRLLMQQVWYPFALENTSIILKHSSSSSK